MKLLSIIATVMMFLSGAMIMISSATLILKIDEDVPSNPPSLKWPLGFSIAGYISHTIAFGVLVKDWSFFSEKGVAHGFFFTSSSGLGLIATILLLYALRLYFKGKFGPALIAGLLMGFSVAGMIFMDTCILLEK